MKNIYKNTNLTNLPNEQWKDIEGFEGLYQVSNMGRIKALKREIPNPKNPEKVRVLKEHIMKCQLDNGYVKTQIYKDGKKKTIKVHREVASAFIPNPENKPTVNHIKEDEKSNNCVSNLEWATHSEQLKHGTYIQRNVESNRKSGFKGVQKMKEVNSKKVLCITTKKVFNSVREAAEFYGIDSSGLSKCCRGKFTYCGTINGTKLEWKYIE